MKYFKIKIKVKSSLSTPIMGDTVFGHICWGIKYHEGEAELERFIKEYDDNAPPLIISNGFLSDMIPVPLLEPNLPISDVNLDDLNKIKKVKKAKYIPVSCFKSENESISEEKIGLAFKNEKNFETHYKVNERLHNTIDRFSGQTLDEGGGLFAVEEMWYDEKHLMQDIYVVSSLSESRLKEIFTWGFENGYGADKSTGKGNIDVLEVKSIIFNKPNGNNIRAMSLGHFVPCENDKIKNLKSDIFTKFGKLGGDYVLYKNPFKKPVVMYAEGATFSTEDDKYYVGSLLKDVHTDPNIRHHAFSPIIFFNEE